MVRSSLTERRCMDLFAEARKGDMRLGFVSLRNGARFLGRMFRRSGWERARRKESLFLEEVACQVPWEGQWGVE